MVNLCVICTCHDSLKPLSDEHRAVLETLVSTAVNLWELRTLKLLVCSACMSLIKSLAQFRNTAINGVKHLLLLSQKQLIEPEEVYIKGEPSNKGKSVDTFLEIEQEPECEKKLQDGIKTEWSETVNCDNIQDVTPKSSIQVTDTHMGEVEKAQDSRQTPLILQSERTAVYTHSKVVQPNGIPQNETTIVAAYPRIQLVPQNPPPHFFDPPQFLPNPYYSLNMPTYLPPIQPANVMPPFRNMPTKRIAPKPVAPKQLEERNPELKSDNNNRETLAGEVIIEPRWYTRVLSQYQMLRARAKERSEPEFVNAPYKCSSCILLFATQEEMDAHAKEHVLASDELPCKVCALPVRPSDEDAHETRHATRLQCARCAFSTEHLNVIEAHDCGKPVKKIRKRKKYDNTFQCVLCRTQYADQAGLDRHNERTHKNPEVFKCNVCNKEFAGKGQLYVHNRSKHKAKEDLEAFRPELYCAECDKAFTSVHLYRQHRMIRKHCPQDDLKYECDLCKKKFRNKGELRGHIRWAHSVEKDIVCKECGKSLPNRYKLRCHVRTHVPPRERPRPHVCHLCGKAFTIKKSLEEHVLMHSGLRPHACALCAATFTYKAALFTHNRLKHLQIKKDTKKRKEDKAERTKKDKPEKVKRKTDVGEAES